MFLNYTWRLIIFRNECWELAATGDKETTLQKYYRLKFETEELLQEISLQKVSFSVLEFSIPSD